MINHLICGISKLCSSGFNVYANTIYNCPYIYEKRYKWQMTDTEGHIKGQLWLTKWCNKIELKITVLTLIYLKLIKTIYVTAGLKYQTLLITLNCFTKNIIIITINVLNGVVILYKTLSFFHFRQNF